MEVLAGPYTDPTPRLFVNIIQIGDELRLRIEDDSNYQDVATIAEDEGKLCLILRTISVDTCNRMGIGVEPDKPYIKIETE